MSANRDFETPHRLMPTRKRERNQQLFRQVNERIRDANASFELTPTEPVEFVCECGDPHCTEQVTLTLVEYERIPRIGGSFLVKPGHERDGQRVVERNDGYAIVEDLTAAHATLAAAPSSQHDDAAQSLAPSRSPAAGAAEQQRKKAAERDTCVKADHVRPSTGVLIVGAASG